MSVGNLDGNIKRLVDHLYGIDYPIPVSASKLRAGDPSTLLQMIHYAFLDYSPFLARFIAEEVRPA
jgi:hypothetical protein